MENIKQYWVIILCLLTTAVNVGTIISKIPYIEANREKISVLENWKAEKTLELEVMNENFNHFYIEGTLPDVENLKVDVLNLKAIHGSFSNHIKKED